MRWCHASFRSSRFIVEGGNIWLDVGTEFLGTVAHIEGHGFEGGVVPEFIIGERAVCIDWSEMDSEENGKKSEDRLAAA